MWLGICWAATYGWVVPSWLDHYNTCSEVGRNQCESTGPNISSIEPQYYDLPEHQWPEGLQQIPARIGTTRVYQYHVPIMIPPAHNRVSLRCRWAFHIIGANRRGE